MLPLIVNRKKVIVQRKKVIRQSTALLLCKQKCFSGGEADFLALLKSSDFVYNKSKGLYKEAAMNIFDILGPVMVGPSSSHTAGAVRIGYISQKLLGSIPERAEIFLHGSFSDTGVGHGTDKALIAGLLGMSTDDMDIPNSFELAEKEGMQFSFGDIELENVHPNSVLLKLKGRNGRELKIVASSLGGGRISIVNIDDIETNFTGEYPTLIVHNLDQPGHVAEVASMLAHKSVNIATLNLYRSKKGGYAVMILETDQEIPPEALEWLERVEGVIKVTYLNIKEE